MNEMDILRFTAKLEVIRSRRLFGRKINKYIIYEIIVEERACVWVFELASSQIDDESWSESFSFRVFFFSPRFSTCSLCAASCQIGGRGFASRSKREDGSDIRGHSMWK